MKIFLAMPYTQFCDENYEVKKEYRQFFEKLTMNLKSLNCDYFLAHERENWGKEYTSDKESTLIDYETIKEVDLVCMIPGIPYSGGVHVELGWASSSKRRINLFLKKGETYSPMVTGISSLTDAKYYYYDQFDSKLIHLIIDSIKERMK